MLKYFFIVIIVSLSAAGCAGSLKTENEKLDLIQKISAEKFGSPFQILFNKEHSFAISVKQEKKSNLNPFPRLTFFIYDFAKDKIIFEDEADRGEARWKDSDIIEVNITPGMVAASDENKPSGYLYNAKTGIKSDLNKQN